LLDELLHITIFEKKNVKMDCHDLKKKKKEKKERNAFNGCEAGLPS